MSASSHPGLAFPKGTPPVIDKFAAKLQREREDKAAKAAVRERDGRWCVICQHRRASEVHEALTFCSKGGRPSLQNSIYVCAQPRGVCHQLLQANAIDVEAIGDDCSNRLTLSMSREVYAVVKPRASDARRAIVIVEGSR